MSAFSAEILGTAALILLGNGVVANVVLQKTKGHQSGWIVITMGWAMGVFTGVLISQDASGAHLNPAVTLALALAEKFPWGEVVPYILAQFLGASIGSALVWLKYRDHYRATPDPDLKLATFCTSPAIRNIPNNLFSEVIGTMVLIISVLMLSGPNFVTTTSGEIAGLGSLGALPVALIVLVIGLALGGTTGYAINPARDLAPRFMHFLLPIPGKGSSEWSYAWVPVVGPVAGACLAVSLLAALSP